MRQLAQEQGEEALRTGAVPEVQIPAVQQAIQATMAAIARARRSTEEGFATVPGFGRTPFAQRILAEQDVAGNLALAGIPVAGAMQAARLGLSTAIPGLQVGIQGLSGAAATDANVFGSQARIRAAEIGADAAITSSIFNSLANIGFAVGTAGLSQ